MGRPRHLTKGDAEPTRKNGLLRLYGIAFCPYDQRVKLVLETKNVPHESVNIKLSAKPDWFLSKGTDGKVPTLELDGGVVLAESLIIADYLDEVHPKPALYPADPLAKAQEKILIGKFGSVMTTFHKFVAANGFTADNLEAFVKSLLPYEAELQKRGTKFFGGSEPGMLDLMIFPWLERSPMLPLTGGPEFELPSDRLGLLLQWTEQMLQVPTVQKTTLPPSLHKKFFDSRTSDNFYDLDYDIE